MKREKFQYHSLHFAYTRNGCEPALSSVPLVCGYPQCEILRLLSQNSCYSSICHFFPILSIDSKTT